MLIKFLKRVQEYGVKADIHFKKPYMYTGSWMEYIHSLEDLMANIEATTSSEATLKVFNILFPFTKPLPGFEGDEEAIHRFFGEHWDPENLKDHMPADMKRKLAERGIRNLLGYNEEEEKDEKREKVEVQEGDPAEVRDLKLML